MEGVGEMTLRVIWIDGGRKAKELPDMNYPNGIALDMSEGAVTTCSTPLPYPAKRCGAYQIACTVCGLRALVTTAGRCDDPCSVKLGCKLN